MELNELIVTGAAIALQLITIWLWLYERDERRTYRAMYDQLARTCVRRDPRTGRYIKKGR